MAYDDKPTRYTHFYDWGSAVDETISIKGPKGKAGFLWDYGVYGVIEVFNGGTVTPKIAIGTTSDADAYGEEFDLDGVADNDGKSVRQTYRPDESTWDSYMVDRTIPADTEIYMTFTGATGSPTGQGTGFVDIIWDK